MDVGNTNKALDGKTALVTGSTSGIGRGIALELAKAGATVLVTGRRQRRIEETVRMIEELGGTAYGRVMDVTNYEDIHEFFTSFVKPRGIDIFVNNAGITAIKNFVDNTQEEIEAICRTDLLGAVYCTQEAARLMIEQSRGGNIVMITSCNAVSPLPRQAFYSSIKCALEGLVKGIAWELSKYHIRVNSVAPGAVVSELTGIRTEEEQKKIGEQFPIPRMGQPEDIGKAVRFLVSEEASYITGTSLLVDGGLVLRGA